AGAARQGHRRGRLTRGSGPRGEHRTVLRRLLRHPASACHDRCRLGGPHRARRARRPLQDRAPPGDQGLQSRRLHRRPHRADREGGDLVPRAAARVISRVSQDGAGYVPDPPTEETDVPHRTLSVESLTKVFDTAEGPVTAVKDVSLEVSAGEFFSLLGPSGCGKTTTLRMIAGLETTTSGTIR